MDFILIFKAFLSLLFVIGLMLVTLWLMKYCQVNMHKAKFLKKMKSDSRIDVLETKKIDAKNSLVLIRRDEVEHLVLLSASQNVLIESGIVKKVRNR